jgi:AcrR family transcriptional regulator
MAGDGPRPQRADALRNRARVLEAAEAVFASEGIGAPVDIIAEKAGVGVGTLYRHFPTKEKLYEAILIDRIAELTADARARLDSDDPGGAFFGFVAHMVAQSVLKRDLINALAGAGVEWDVVAAEAKREMQAAIAELLAVAQEVGAVRADVTGPVVFSLIGATCMATGGPYAASPDDMLGIVFDGLRVSRPEG